MKRNSTLLMDAVINLVLGLLLIFFSPDVIAFFGVPQTDTCFYPNILGGVLFGIGLALLITCFGKKQSGTGLGLGGAVAINLCGGVVLAFWLVFREMHIPAGGRIFLWVLVLILVGISTIEWLIHRRNRT
jgi:hypothetical protein